MSRWFFSFAINYRSYHVFETSEYGDKQGYATKIEAVDAALRHANDEIKKSASLAEYNAHRVIEISAQRVILEGMRNER